MTLKIDLEQLKQLYLEGKGSREIAKIAGVHSTTIIKYLRDYGVTIRPTSSIRLYNVNDDYFETIDSKDKAYWLGWMFSDGFVTRQNTFGINIQEKDVDILTKFAFYLKADNYKIKYAIKTKSYGMRFSSKKICADLNNYGIIPNKSLVLYNYLPESSDLIPHFIRGVFDGDGNIYITKKNDLRFRICGGCPEFLKYIQAYLVEELDLNDNKLYNKENTNVHYLSYTGNKVAPKIYKLLYKNCDDLYLKRKKDKYDNFLNKT